MVFFREHREVRLRNFLDYRSLLLPNRRLLFNFEPHRPKEYSNLFFYYAHEGVNVFLPRYGKTKKNINKNAFINSNLHNISEV